MRGCSKIVIFQVVALLGRILEFLPLLANGSNNDGIFRFDRLIGHEEVRIARVGRWIAEETREIGSLRTVDHCQRRAFEGFQNVKSNL